MASPMRSPYAAPHTPIASSKRPRVAAKSATKATPASAIKTSQFQSPTKSEYQNETIDNNKHKISNGNQSRREPVVPPTPSKVLFSPMLRNTDQPGQHPQNSVQPIQRSRSSNQVAEDDEELYLAGIDEEIEVEAKENINQSNVAVVTNAAAAACQQEEQAAEEEDDGVEEFNPYQFIAHLPPHASVCIVDKICLPPLVKISARDPTPITLALDLDETLVHCTVEPIAKPDLVFPVTFNGQLYQIYVRKRPYLDYFLEAVSKTFEVVVFTASQRVYADVLLDKLDPQRKFVKHRLFREACLLVQGNYLKDLHVLGRDLKKSVLVDNSPHAYSYHVDNGIPIESWYDDEQDTELLKLLGFLKTLQNADDVRPAIREHFKTYHLVERARQGLPVSLSAPPF